MALIPKKRFTRPVYHELKRIYRILGKLSNDSPKLLPYLEDLVDKYRQRGMLRASFARIDGHNPLEHLKVIVQTAIPSWCGTERVIGSIHRYTLVCPFTKQGNLECYTMMKKYRGKNPCLNPWNNRNRIDLINTGKSKLYQYESNGG